MGFQRCWGGVRLLNGAGPSLRNVQKLDGGAIPMIIRMQQRGLQVDLAHFAKMETELERDMEQITEDVRQITGHYINIDSGDQVADLLFKKLGLKQAREKLTTSGDRESVEDEVLKAIQHEHPVISKIQNYKEYSKLLGTYVRPMPKLARRTAFGKWRMYPHFNTTRVPSGRLACKDPNLLAMPTRTERGRDIRRGFITDQGWCFVSIDESQIEVRLAAHLSQDPNLVRIYFNKEDIYSDFAIKAFKLADKRFKNQEGKWEYPGVDAMGHRYPAKTCILASIYDVSALGLQEQMPVICATCGKPAICVNCQKKKKHDTCVKHDCHKFVSLWSEEKCQQLINSFYLEYPGVMRDRIKNHGIAKRNAFVWDMWGRILHCAAVRSMLPWVVSAALREVGNFPYQAGAQGTVKLTMAQCDYELEEMHYYDICAPLLSVHDELIFECREDVADDLIAYVGYVFENCCKLEVPIKTGGVKAESWGSLEK